MQDDLYGSCVQRHARHLLLSLVSLVKGMLDSSVCSWFATTRESVAYAIAYRHEQVNGGVMFMAECALEKCMHDGATLLRTRGTICRPVFVYFVRHTRVLYTNNSTKHIATLFLAIILVS